MSLAPVLMVQGASSSVGKSWLTTALCRIFARSGLRVAPFKAQNMSNNAAVCPDGGEIGRAQAVQALAAGLEPHVDMNPILLKPEADSRSQVIVRGRVWKTLPAGEYYRYKKALWSVVTEALDRLRRDFDLVIAEGAGSPAELNLRAGDLVNMAVARYANAAVLLAGDIDRGGVFAQLLGTLWLLPHEEQRLIQGFVVNKFRGDPALFADGVRILEARGRRPVLGVIPFIPDLIIPTEDAASLPRPAGASKTMHPSSLLDIAVIQFPRIANFDDMDPLRAAGAARVRFVSTPAELGHPDAIILPGSKSVAADLSWLRETGLAAAVLRLAQNGTALVGLCGGYQMLGRVIRDPFHFESDADETPGLGLLPVETVFDAEKATYQTRARVDGGLGWMAQLAGEEIEGYEIHMGRTHTLAPWLTITARNGQPAHLADGAVAAGGRIWGCYLHGVFANDVLRQAWLNALSASRYRRARPLSTGISTAAIVEQSLNRWADIVSECLDMERIEAFVDL